jgi:hypothetical protein
MEEAMQFRNDVEDSVEMGTSPPEPHLFLTNLLDGVEAQAERLREAAADEPDREQQQQITGYVEGLTDSIGPVRAALEQSQFGTFDLV